jgi:hypothetical protein
MPTPRTRSQQRRPANGTPPRPLIRRYARYNPRTLEDLLALLAANVEDAFLMAGATPGVDYSHRDCFTLAAPFALSMFQDKTADITLAIEWPEYLGQAAV